MTFTPNTGFSGEAVFQYQLTDDAQGTVLGTVKVAVAPRNDPPVAKDDAVFAIEDTKKVIAISDLLANDTDVDSDPLELSAVLNASHGTVSIVGGVVEFTPDSNFAGTAGFDYVVTDNASGSDIGHVTVDVVSTNLMPVIGVDTFIGTEDTPLIVSIASLMANDFDPNPEDVLTFVSVETDVPGGRAFVLPDGSIELAPRDNINGEVQFYYTITDGRLNSPEYMTVTSSDGSSYTQKLWSIIVDFAAVNDAPVVGADSGFVTVEDQSIVIPISQLLANDSDVEGDLLSVVGVLDPFNGTAAMVGDTIVFTPRADYFGNASFAYRVADGHGGFTNGEVSLTVLPTNDLPTAVSDSNPAWTIDEDHFIVIDPAELLANDVDPDGDQITFVSASGAGVTMLPGGMIQFTPSADANGHFALSYQITDGKGPAVAGTFSVFVRPVDDAPVAGDDALHGVEDAASVIAIASLVANDSDPDGQNIGLTSVGNAVGGTVALDGVGNVVFTPGANVNGPVSFDYVVTDVTGATDSATVTIDLTPVNDAPVIAPLTPLVGTEDVRFVGQLPAGAFQDIDGDALTLTATMANGDPLPAWLTFTPSARGFAGQPPLNFAGSLDLQVSASDGHATATRGFKLVFQAVNDAPVAVDDVVQATEDQTILITPLQLLANDVDVDGDTLTITAVTAGGNATATLDASGNVRIERATNFSGDIDLTYTISDGTLSSTAHALVTVAPVNDAPVIAPLAPISMNEDGALLYALPADAVTDPEGDPLTVSLALLGGAALPSWIAFDASTKTITAHPPVNYNGSIDLQLAASDGQLTTVAALKLDVLAVNDAPTLLAPFSDRFVVEDTPFNIRLQDGLFSDVDGDGLTYSMALADGSPLPSWITADLSVLRLSGLPPVNFTGALDVRVTASDGSATTSDVFKFAVTPVNDAPVVANLLPDILDGADNLPLLKAGTPFSIPIPASSFSDPDGDPLQFAAREVGKSGLPSWMTFDGNKLTGTAPTSILNAQGVAEFNIEILASDGTLQNSDAFVVRFGADTNNRAPIVGDDGPYTVYAPQAINIPVSALLSNDIDPEQQPLSFVSVGPGGHGTVSVLTQNTASTADDVIRYLPTLGYVGNDQFIYTVSDGAKQSSGTVSVVVDGTYSGYAQGTAGNDTVTASNGANSAFFGGAGNDVIVGAMNGGSYAGGTGDDTIIARGKSHLDGNEGNDTLIGSGGADVLNGGIGNDILTGGAGKDVFIFNDNSGSDVITDFDAGRRTRQNFVAGDMITIDLAQINSFDDLMGVASQESDGVLFAFGGGNELFLKGTMLAALDKDSFTFV